MSGHLGNSEKIDEWLSKDLGSAPEKKVMKIKMPSGKKPVLQYQPGQIPIANSDGKIKLAAGTLGAASRKSIQVQKEGNAPQKPLRMKLKAGNVKLSSSKQEEGD